jgi:hypothetical protein
MKKKKRSEICSAVDSLRSKKRTKKKKGGRKRNNKKQTCGGEGAQPVDNPLSFFVCLFL